MKMALRGQSLPPCELQMPLSQKLAPAKERPHEYAERAGLPNR